MREQRAERREMREQRAERREQREGALICAQWFYPALARIFLLSALSSLLFPRGSLLFPRGPYAA
jgi:hypothetical protein